MSSIFAFIKRKVIIKVFAIESLYGYSFQNAYYEVMESSPVFDSNSFTVASSLKILSSVVFL